MSTPDVFEPGFQEVTQDWWSLVVHSVMGSPVFSEPHAKLPHSGQQLISRSEWEANQVYQLWPSLVQSFW
jgi:hypothetical protein